ncbi:hypothetical protein AOR_1_536074 [Paecilomyces variotii No. 5]|uniref:ER-bound oxygenase mpaB/mpaB'/Rubber oxygenase catalytic domain-containing protein n=1 Tax=Byssochlamys spectabilis (strain No. 5 / NBRC 109023) TaxID=1356009 RepID=V5GCM6_BYSSN|nr:hypothetical protein AOR_1_536074 [Paecilomyces variotii No. 5]
MENATTYLFETWQPPGLLSQAVQTIKDATPGQILSYALVGLIAYPTIVSLLRFRRLKKLHKKYHYPTRESMTRMTDNEAWEIQKAIAQLEFPFMYIKSLQFALFRTYGIPTISSLLVGTGQFSNPRNSLKRYVDTSVLIGEFVAYAPTSDRSQSAIARVNYLHSSYRDTGKILEDDMLYTLSLFALEPIRFIETYEWRKLSELEQCALGTYWKSLGDAMQISYEALPSYKTGFRDGLHWLEEMDAWRTAYEKEKMVPHLKNKETADQTTAVLVYMLPSKLKHIGINFVSFMMDDRLRRAMMYEPPAALYAMIFSAVLAIRKFFLRYLALPRPYFLRIAQFSDQENEHGRFYAREWDAAPYYVKPTLWNRWGPTAWLTWVLGLPLPGDEGDKYYPEGYSIVDVGPKYREGKGREYVEAMKNRLHEERTGKCPFH